MTTKKKKFSEMEREDKVRIVRATFTVILFALIAAAFAVNIFSCQVGDINSATRNITTAQQTINFNNVVNNSKWSLNATNVESGEIIPEAWYKFESFTVDSTEGEEENGSVHLVTVTKDAISHTAYLVLSDDGEGTLEISPDCILDVHIAKLSGTQIKDAEYLMRISKDNEIVELIPAKQ